MNMIKLFDLRAGFAKSSTMTSAVVVDVIVAVTLFSLDSTTTMN